MEVRYRSFALALFAVVSAGITAAVPTAEAQYFGRNKVQYEGFDFKVLRTEHFDIYYYPEEQLAIEYAALMAERWYARLSRLLNHQLSGRQALILYAAHPHFRQTNVLQGNLGEGTGGVTEILKRRIVLPFAGPLQESDHVIGHELVHAFQFDITGDGGGVLRAGVPTAARLPLWFVEGMAEYLSLGPEDPNTAMWMRDAVKNKLPDYRKLNDPRFFPYRYGQALWAYIGGRWGDETVGRVLKASRLTGSAGVALGRVLRINPDTLIANWHRAMIEAYQPVFEQTQPASEYGRLVLSEKTGGGFYNLAPALSPDGRKVVFLSEKDLFSIEMYLADVQTGQIERKLSKAALDPHFEGLQSISSAGAWDLAGKRFVFAAISRGKPVLTILDMPSGNREREILLSNLDEIFNPSWSPDGRSIVFSAQVGGLADLYTYDLETDQLKRLTNDAYADLQPVYSPDGTKIAFVTDRFTTGLTSLLYGGYQLALIDPKTGAIKEVIAFESGKHINPHWAPDGTSLYFISDQSGISNVYRVRLASGELTQITNLYTGVSGITALSPALGVAAKTGEIAMSVYSQDGYGIYLLDQPGVLAGGPVAPAFSVNAAQLPPEDRFTDDVRELLRNAFYGLPSDTAQFASRDYRAGFGLDYVGQPSLVVGADRFGTFIGGGASLFWSDMLGGHNLATALQVNGGVKDISALVGYTNLTHRWNWGLVAQQVPFRSVGFSFFQDPNTGNITEEELIFRQINRQVGTTVAYPFNQSRRIEFFTGFTNVTFDLEQRIRTFDFFTGSQIGETKRDLDPVSFFGLNHSALNMGQGSVALIYDNSYFGIASPILGQRYRIEFGGSFGTLNYETALGDFRKYLLVAWPFTLAGRVVHYGRYGADADAPELTPLFLGWPNLVRGYSFGSFEARECQPTADNPTGCPVFDQLFGSKIVVANAEFRFPPFALFSDGGLGFFPLELAIFGDAGLAWESDISSTAFDERAFFLGGDRKPVYSAGFGGRINVLGLGIIELDWVHPFNRPDKGSHLQFSFTPGF